MNDDPAEPVLEQQLRAAFGSPNPPDFDTWRSHHADAIARLSPAVTARQQSITRNLMWTTRAAAVLAVGIIVIVLLNVGPEQTSLAQAIKAVESAQTADTATWTRTGYSRESSKDGKETWLRSDRTTVAYKRPGHYREIGYDEQGIIRSVRIIDLEQNKALYLNMKDKKAGWDSQPNKMGQYGFSGPMAAASPANLLDKKDIQLVGERKVGDGAANVFRFHANGNHVSVDLWIDKLSKQLLGYSVPGSDVFDPETMPDRNNPPGKVYMGTPLGFIEDQIVINPKLDDELFSMTVPEGFEVIAAKPAPPPVTEERLIEYLRTTAEFNQGTFFDTAKGPGIDLINHAAKKDAADRTAAEQKMVDLNRKNMLAGQSYPLLQFDGAEPKSFRYIGGGVKLGDASHIVCWYKLKSTGKYRAIYGDLTIKDVESKDLPLLIE